MKFNEKLIKLRKEKGFSQEELGYKLNVTRQTVSKWELGQTTPEMDKLVELSKIYGITLDELTSEEETTSEVKEENNVEEKNKGSKKQENNEPKDMTKILLGILILLIIIAIVWGVAKVSASKNSIGVSQNNGGFFDTFFGIFKDASNMINENSNTFEDMKEIQNNVQNKFNETQKQMERDSFNSRLEIHNGTEKGLTVKSVIDDIVTNNKKNKEQKITVIYKEKSMVEASDIQSLKSNFEDWTEYEISFEYDEEGYIYQMDIKDIEKQNNQIDKIEETINKVNSQIESMNQF